MKGITWCYRLALILVLSLFIFPVFLEPIEVSGQITIGPPGDFFNCGAGAADTIRESYKNCEAAGLGSNQPGAHKGLCTMVDIYASMCNDGKAPAELLVTILKFYGQWERFVYLMQKADKTAQELEELKNLLNFFSPYMNSPTQSTDLISLLQKYNGKAGQLGGFCNADNAIGTCLYTMKPFFNSAGNYQYSYDANNQPTQLIPRNGQSTYNYCKIPMCDPSNGVQCINGCAGGLDCCAQNAGPDMNRYFQPTAESEQQMTMVSANWKGADVSVISQPNNNNGGSGTATGAGTCQSTQPGFSCVCVLPGQACSDGSADCKVNNLRRFRQAMSGGGCSDGYEQWYYSTGGNAADNACTSTSTFCHTDGSYSICEGDGLCCPSTTINPGGNVPWNNDPCSCKCPNGDKLANTVTAGQQSKCSVACGNSAPPVDNGNNGGGNQPASCDPKLNELINGVCTLKMGCLNGNKACGACETCVDDGSAGTCAFQCSGDTPVCDTNNQCVKKTPCPYLYSVTQNGEKFEDALLEVQYSPLMDDPYYSKLSSFDDSVNKLRIKEPFEEVSYINSVKVIKAVHPEGSSVLINGIGEVVTIGNLLPVKCTSRFSGDCTGEIEATDSAASEPFLPLPGKLISKESYGKQAYSTDLTKIDLNNEDTYKDYLELTLPQTDAKQAKLVLVSSLTPNVAKFGQKFAMDHEKLLPLIYSLLNYQAIGNAAKKSAEDAGYIHIQVQDNLGNWVDYSDDRNSVFVTNFIRESVVLLDTDKIRQNKVRIKFTSGAYAFDYIAVDYSPNEVISVQELLPQDAVDKNANPVPEVYQYDNLYKKLKQNDEITVGFANSESKATYFAETTGYYQPGNETQSVSLDFEEMKSAMDLIFKKNYAERYLLELILNNP